MARIFLLLVLAAALVGCTHYYSKPGMTTAGFAKDKRDCQNGAVEAAQRNNTQFCDEVERCLLAKGWKRN